MSKLRLFVFTLLSAVLAFAQSATPSYTPAFVSGLTITGPAGLAVASINPAYCLQSPSAVSLAQLPDLAPYISGIGYAPPVQLSAAGPFGISALCPYFVYVNGAPENAASVGGIFSHGYPYATAVQQAIAEITAVMNAFAAGSPYTAVQVSGVQPVPAVAPVVAATPAPPPAPSDPVGQVLPDGRYQDLSGNSLPIGSTYTDSRGSFTKAGSLTLFGTVYWWVVSAK
jgi:hypothetical protein